MTFNQMMGLPVELTLHSTSSGASLLVNPARELKSLRQTTHAIEPQTLKPGANPLAGIHGDLFEIEAEIAVGDAREIAFDLRGLRVGYNVATQKISCMGNQAALVPKDGNISLRIFVDRASIDIYGGGGTLYMPMAAALSPENQSLKLSCQDGEARIVSLKVYELKSAWE
jgi:fructan beta-fructosidase